jgi:NDP-sugar pyrophosphorylase family protein
VKVCITAAGLGSRMGAYAGINKALLPVEGEAALTTIIESFPKAEFVIAVGHLADQVRDYCALAHPDLPITFVDVPAYEGPGTGPLRSLYACREQLREPFLFVACDTLFERPFNQFYNPFSGSMNVAYYHYGSGPSYSFLEVDSGKQGIYVTGTRIPPHHDSREFDCLRDDGHVFTGMLYLADFDIFWSMAEASLAAGEVELLHAVQRMLEHTLVMPLRLPGWTDIGTEDRYRKVVERTQDFDFSKPDEFIYRVGDRVIKWFANTEIATNRVKRAAMRPGCFPEIEEQRGGFYSYRFLPGQTLYEDNSVPKFRAFLEWMSDHMWEEVPTDISANLRPFYVDKTLSRLAMFRAKYPGWQDFATVNGEAVLPIDELLDKVGLEEFPDNAIPSFVHGDLQFDNIIHGPEGFRLLDWRQDFGGRLDLGDLYYDLAKLLGGIRLNYSFVKRNLLTFKSEGGAAKIEVMQSMMTSDYENLFWDFVRDQGLSVTHIEQLLGVIYLNMAPLHHAPFDKFLYALAQRTLTESLPWQSTQYL